MDHNEPTPIASIDASRQSVKTIPIDAITFVKELYPRRREDDAAIERCRAGIDKLPPIVVARGRILVDGFHRWQAHKREDLTEIAAIDLGNLSDIEILKESIKRNSTHGRQLEISDKKYNADVLYRQGVRDTAELMDLLSITQATLETYLRDAKRDEKQAQKDKAWDLWLNCMSERDVAEAVGVDQATINRWIRDAKADGSDFASPPESRQHYNIWTFHQADDTAGQKSYFGRMPPQIVENLLWYYTEPGQIVFDPFAGGGTTIDVCKAMGRRVWSSDRKPSTPILPIHEHDILTGWPEKAPARADLIILDPPYWEQAKGKYSDDPTDLGNMELDAFNSAWKDIVGICSDHLTPTGRIAYIISSTNQEHNTAVDHAIDMLQAFYSVGMRVQRRIIVPYQTQQINGTQVIHARENKTMLNLYRDLVVLSK